MNKFILVFFITFSFLFSLNADFKVDPIFKTGTVIQHGQPIFIYGKSDPGTKVKVSLKNKSKSTKTDDSGNWIVELRAMKPEENSVNLDLECKLKSGKALRNYKVYIGDVWLFAGGGNIEYSFKKFKYLKSEFDKLEMTKEMVIKGLPVSRSASNKPEEETKTYMNHAWFSANDERQGENNNPLSAFFAYNVVKMFEYPVGIISMGYKDSRIDSWIPSEALDEINYNKREKPISSDGKISHDQSSVIYNGMVNPFTKFAVRGVVWYPSMADVREQDDYGKLSKALITSWRKAFNNPEMPFFMIQAQSSGQPSWNKTGEALAWFRETQNEALELPETYLVPTTDLGEEKSFYTSSQKAIADRMMIHLVKMKRKKTINNGPKISKIKPVGYKITLEFDNDDNGLEARQVTLNKSSGLAPGSESEGGIVIPEDKLVGFEICGRDGVFHPAEAVIKGRSVEIYSKNVRRPAAIRYGWSSMVKANLYNEDGLPALPFRTDKMPRPNFEGELESKKVTLTSIIGQPMEAVMKVGDNTLEKVNVGDAEAFKVIAGKGKKDHYAFFKNTNSDIKDGKKSKLKVMIVYFDEGSGIIEVRYDSNDQKFVLSKNKPGMYKMAGKIKLTGTNTWRYVEVDLNDALFSNRLWGPSDIRLKSNSSFKISGIFVQPL